VDKDEGRADPHHDHHDRDGDGRDDHRGRGHHKDDGDNHGHHGHHKKGLASVVLPPSIGRFGQFMPNFRFARQTHELGELYEMQLVDGKPQAFTADFLVMLSEAFSEVKPHETIRFELFSPIAENNNCRGAAAVAEWRYTEKGPADSEQPNDFRSSHRLEMKAWDYRCPGGRVLVKNQQPGHLSSLEVYLPVTARDAGEYRWVISRNGHRVAEHRFRVAEPPAPEALGWIRRSAGRYLPPAAPSPVAAYIHDEWLLRSEEVPLPQPRREPRRGRPLDDPLEKTVTWSWWAPSSSRRNKSCKRTYLTIENSYWSDNLSWKIETRAYDALYPRGRVVRKRTGAGRLDSMLLTEGAGLGPQPGTWKFRAEVDGKDKPSEKLSLRAVGLVAEPPRAVGAGLVSDSASYEITVKSTGFVPRDWTWTLRLKSIQSGAVLRTLTGEITGNTQPIRTYGVFWDGRTESGQRVLPGTGVFPEFEIRLPQETVAARRAGARVAAAAVAEDHSTPVIIDGVCHFYRNPCNCDCVPPKTRLSSPLPIDVSNGLGTVSHDFADMAIPTRGLPLVLSHHYNSENDRELISDPTLELAARTGRGGWSFSFEHVLRVDPYSGRAIYVRPDGSQETWRPAGLGFEPIHDHNTGKLRRLGNDFELTFKNKTRYIFSGTHGHLTNQIDRHGNTNDFVWALRNNGQWQLDRISGPQDKQRITFEWRTALPVAGFAALAPGAGGYPFTRPLNPLPVPSPRPTPLPIRQLVATDHTGRHVTFDWTRQGDSGLYGLSRVTQLGGTVWQHTYRYSPALHLIQLHETSLNGVLQESLLTSPLGTLQSVSHRAPHDNGAIPLQVETLSYKSAIHSSHPPVFPLTNEFTLRAPGLPFLTTRFELNSHLAVTKVTDPAGHVTRYERINEDPLGGGPQPPHPEAGKLDHFLINVIDPNQNATGGNLAVNLGWNPDTKNLVRVTDQLGHSTEYDYDSEDNLTHVRVAGVNVTAMGYNSRSDLTSMTVPDQGTTHLSYFPDGLLESVRDANNHVWSFGYDDNGFLASITAPPAHAGEEAARWSFKNDELGRRTESTDPVGNKVEYVYDTRDRLTQVIQPAVNTPDPTASPGSGLLQVPQPVAVTTYRWNANDALVNVTDAQNRTVNYLYDAAVNLVEVRGPGAAGTQVSLANLTYGSRGDLARLQTPSGSTHYTHDILRQLKVRTLPDGALEQFDYDPNGNLKFWKSNRIQVDYAYDAASRLKHLTASDGEHLAFTYTERDELARVSKSGPSASESRWTYLDSGLVHTATADDRTISYTYDALGRVSSLVDPEGEATHYTWSNRGDLDSATLDGQTVRYGYDLAGRQDRKSFPNGISCTRTFDERSRLLKLDYKRGVGEPILSLLYNHNQMGLRTQIQRVTQSVTRTDYRYNDKDELLQSTRSKVTPTGLIQEEVRSYGYDENHNRVSYSRTPANGTPEAATYSHEAGSDKLLEPGGYTYNGDGTTKHGDGYGYKYNFRGQISKVYAPEGYTSYYYDGLGRRVAKAFDGALPQTSPSPSPPPDASPPPGDVEATHSIHYLWSGSEVIKEYAKDRSGSSTTVKAAYLLGSGREGIRTGGTAAPEPSPSPSADPSPESSPVPQIVAQRFSLNQLASALGLSSEAEWNWYLTDHLGSTAMLTDSTGQVVAEYDYGDFGETTQTFGDPSLYNPYRWTGQQFDPEAGPGGLYFLRNRSYSPKIARFLTRDPIMYAGGSNLYAYCGNDPINYYDPSGLFWQELGFVGGKVLEGIGLGLTLAGGVASATGKAITIGGLTITPGTGPGGLALAGGGATVSAAGDTAVIGGLALTSFGHMLSESNRPEGGGGGGAGGDEACPINGSAPENTPAGWNPTGRARPTRRYAQGKEVDNRARLTGRYEGSKRDQWRKVFGEQEFVDESGNVELAEIHWYENDALPGQQFEPYFKRWVGE